mmetsp:Transcript_15848/g.37905  ORF Transcript_15848/g.37905 Transcript_15848/m.37905 type:complete len:248 (+) Transcript_15848:202-945(+)
MKPWPWWPRSLRPVFRRFDTLARGSMKVVRPSFWAMPFILSSPILALARIRHWKMFLCSLIRWRKHLRSKMASVHFRTSVLGKPMHWLPFRGTWIDLESWVRRHSSSLSFSMECSTSWHPVCSLQTCLPCSRRRELPSGTCRHVNASIGLHNSPSWEASFMAYLPLPSRWYRSLPKRLVLFSFSFSSGIVSDSSVERAPLSNDDEQMLNVMKHEGVVAAAMVASAMILSSAKKGLAGGKKKKKEQQT